MESVDGEISRVLIDHALATVDEILRVLCCPPVAEVPVSVELPPLIIERAAEGSRGGGNWYLIEDKLTPKLTPRLGNKKPCTM